jgi:heme-degrading monooxygenase HmoA
MIARVWHGAVPLSKSAEYLRLMQEIALPDYRAIEGNRGAWCLRRFDDDVAHFEMLTFWDDLEAIKRFAGEDYECAKYYEFDIRFLVEIEPRVRHFQIFTDLLPLPAMR